jgi:phosphatidylserine/phosphatidylglycerophosphate/cardiolipin synthase-like enzyme
VKLLIQPADGVRPLLKAINRAKSSIELTIFRFDQGEVERALASAVNRGVFVHALIAHTTRAGKGSLRRLETRLLAEGVNVVRTADDLPRYHGKMMIIDRKEVYVMGFNLTRLDIDYSRSFGVVTRSRKMVQEAARLFEADTKRILYEPNFDSFIVSPVNARKQLARFIKGAKKELLIYDLKVSDPTMIRLLEERVKAGVDVRILGRVHRDTDRLNVRKPTMRVHTRTMVRDRSHAFVGSQSMRKVELDARREIGVILHDRSVISRIHAKFNEDWASAVQNGDQGHKIEVVSAAALAKRVAKAVTKDLPPVAPVLEELVKENQKTNPQEVKEAVKGAVKEAVKEAVLDVVQHVAQRKESEKNA